jgi:hypothetical protein
MFSFVGWRWPFVIFVFEVCSAFLRTNIITLVMSFVGTYHVAGVLYMAWLTLNWAAFLIGAAIHGPFLVNLSRMVYADSETRRRAFYETVLRLWLLYLLTDVWVISSINPDVIAYCEALAIMEDTIGLNNVKGGPHSSSLLAQLRAYLGQLNQI